MKSLIIAALAAIVAANIEDETLLDLNTVPVPEEGVLLKRNKRRSGRASTRRLAAINRRKLARAMRALRRSSGKSAKGRRGRGRRGRGVRGKGRRGRGRRGRGRRGRGVRGKGRRGRGRRGDRGTGMGGTFCRVRAAKLRSKSRLAFIRRRMSAIRRYRARR